MTTPTSIPRLFLLLSLSFLRVGAQPVTPPPVPATGINLLEAVRSSETDAPASDPAVPTASSAAAATAPDVSSPTAPSPAIKEPPAGAVARIISPAMPATHDVSERMPSPLKFVKMKLGNVARVFSARMNLPVTIEAKADAAITGDYSHMDLRRALSDAAGQAGLVVVALGRDGLDGYTMMTPTAVAQLDRNPNGAVDAVMLIARPASTPTDIRAFLLEAAKKRAALLKERQTLLEAELRLMR